MSLKGGTELKARFRAVRLVFKPLGKDWAEDTVDRMRPKMPNDTGRIRRMLKVRNATQHRAVVATHYTATFPDKGAKPHTINVKFRRGATFARKAIKHPGQRAQRFARPAAKAALAHPMMRDKLIDAWNKAA